MSDPQGLVYDPVAEVYERGRTGWPASVADGIAGQTVLDLAAGTGKLTRVLVARFPRVIAYYLSMSTVAARPEPERDDLAATLRELLPDAEHRVRVRVLTYRAERVSSP